MTGTDKKAQRATDIVDWFTLAAIGKGAFPVPATSLAIVANNGCMHTHVSADMGREVHWDDVFTSCGIMYSMNMIGRSVFVEGAKFLGWGTGNWWAFFGLSALGAPTAGLQTYIVGLIANEICKNEGKPIDKATLDRVIEFAKKNYTAYLTLMKSKELKGPSHA